MSEQKAPEREWWFPALTDDKWLERIRADYPEDYDLSDEDLRDKYADGYKYQTLWDHVGDARDDHEKLADAYLAVIAIADRYRAALQKVVEFGKDRCVCADIAREALSGNPQTANLSEKT